MGLHVPVNQSGHSDSMVSMDSSLMSLASQKFVMVQESYYYQYNQNEQTYQSMVIRLRITNRQAYRQKKQSL